MSWDKPVNSNLEKPYTKDGGKPIDVVKEIERQEQGRKRTRKDSNKSKSVKRANHKHVYREIVLLEKRTKVGLVNEVLTQHQYYFSKVEFCEICGRIKDCTYPWNHKDFVFDKKLSEIQTGDKVLYKDKEYFIITDYRQEFEYFNHDVFDRYLIDTAKKLLGLEE